MEFKNLIIIGTSHIAKESVKEIKQLILEKKPEIIALELDPNRFYALVSGEQRRMEFGMIKHFGLKGFLFSLIGAWAQKQLGKQLGVVPGAEMKQAISLAKEYDLKIALIDQNIEVTLKRFSKKLSWREKWNFLVDLFNGFVLRKKRVELEFDLDKVPSKEIIKKVLVKVKHRYPNVYLVLVEERNEFMAKKLITLMMAEPKKRILVIVGAGHEEELIAIIKEKFKNTPS